MSPGPTGPGPARSDDQGAGAPRNRRVVWKGGTSVADADRLRGDAGDPADEAGRCRNRPALAWTSSMMMAAGLGTPPWVSRSALASSCAQLVSQVSGLSLSGHR